MGSGNVKNNRALMGLAVLLLLTVVCVVVQSYDKGYIKVNSDKTNNIKEKVNKKIPAVTESVSDNKNENDSDSKAVSKQIINKNSPKNKYRINPDVRVLINTTGYKSLFHDKISIKCSGAFEVLSGKKIKKYKGGKTVVFNLKDRSLKKGKIQVRSCSDSRLQVMSVKRQEGYPLYRGSLEIVRNKKGLLLKNIVPLEKYLYGVLPSEMPVNNNMNALEAQAVCARSFTYNQLHSGRYDKYGADLDDSVSCQVYNNIREDKRAVKAVDNTENIVMLTGSGKIAVGYYFATSWGCTADGQSVWNTKKPVTYLKGKLQITENSNNKKVADKNNLSDEKNFKKFISKDVYDTYDSKDEWYRWKVIFSKSTLQKRIDSSVGKIKSIRVGKRDKSGLVTELVIIGSKRVKKVRGQYNVRKILAPVNEKIKRKNGSTVEGFSLLPSAAFYIEKMKNGGKESFMISGGGFGHGTGMSQTGAASMAAAGFDYEAILMHYFDGIKTGDISKACF